ncbi:TPA: hypothetical protein PBQ24_003821 [Escherichia coli]|nr:hypothetical protein [Escherichia coli]
MHHNFNHRHFALTFTLLIHPLAIQHAYANQLYTDNIWYRDYLDLAQNKGQFKPGATGITITRKDGTKLELPNIPIPDFSPSNNTGTTTSIGGSYSVTARHNETDGGGAAVNVQKWGNTSYKKVASTYTGDFAVERLDKFNVETEGLEGAEKHDWQGMIDRYGVDYQGKKQIIGFRVGAGTAQIMKNGKLQNLNANFNPNLLSASFFTITQGNGVVDNGFTDFKNITTGGDSGSGYYLYDNQQKKWVLIGVHGGLIGGSNNGYFLHYDNSLVEKFKKEWTQKIALNDKRGVFNGNSSLSIDNVETQIERNKDLSFTGGGTLTVDQNLYLGTGGLLFDKNEQYVVNGQSFVYKGAGVDVGESSIVDWNIKGDPSDNLHKIGKGTLKVNVTQGNNLKVGNGTVELNAEKSFNKIYITSGKATLKLGNDKALNTEDKEFNGLFFAKKGGTLDLNGYDFTSNRIAAADAGALITNSSNLKANANITTTGKYMYHGGFGGNLNLNYKLDSKDKAANGVLVLDGGTDMKGDVNVQNGKLVLQGHATAHATYGNSSSNCPPFICGLPTQDLIMNSERPDANKHNMGYMVDNQISSFSQPDWDNRTYTFKALNLNDAEFSIARNAIVKGDIKASHSKLTIGDKQAYIDQHNGNNITGDGFGFQQNVIAGNSFDPYSVVYIGNITAKDSTIEANNFMTQASFDLENTKYSSNYLPSVTKILDNGITLTNQSDLKLQAAYIQDAKKEVLIAADDTSMITMNSLAVNNSRVKLTNANVAYRIDAENHSIVTLDKWTHHDTNLWSDESSSFNIGKLTGTAGNRINANVTVTDELMVNSSSSNHGLTLNSKSLTLDSDAHVKADLSASAMSIHNMSFGREYTLVSSEKLEDHRNDKTIEFSHTNGMHYTNRTDGNAIKFTIERGEGRQNRVAFFNGNRDERPNAVLKAYAKKYGEEKSNALVKSIVEHNAASGHKYQEVALIDALYNKDTTVGAEALHSIESRTQRTYRDLGALMETQKLFAPVRTAVNNRLASLSMGTVRPEEGESRFFIDAGAGFFNGDDDIHYVHTGFGSDVSIRQDDSDLILGGMFGIGRSNNKFDGNEVKSDMYTLTGYLGWQHTSGWEVQDFLTGAWLDGDRTLKTEINLGGNQVFDEEGWALMNSTYLKYRLPFVEGSWNVALKPMLLADLTWMHANTTNTAFFKRDASSQFSSYAGTGVELEVVGDKSAYFFQLTGKQRLNDDAQIVGVNLNGASGFQQIEASTNASFITDANMMAKLKLTKQSEIDLTIGATIDSNGTTGAHGQVRMNFLF